jgi:Cu-Zn family superoxide dismutase
MPAMSLSSSFRFGVVAIAVIAGACARARVAGSPSASAELRDASGRAVGSLAAAPSASGGVTLTVRVNGLPPGPHGIHVHAVGTCDPAGPTAFASAGGHFNPSSKQHGRLNPNGWHAGDMPNLVVDSAGQGTLTTTVESLTLETGAAALLDADGSAVIIHANADDERTDNGPSGPGNSGARLACGVIRRVG